MGYLPYGWHGPANGNAPNIPSFHIKGWEIREGWLGLPLAEDKGGDRQVHRGGDF